MFVLNPYVPRPEPKYRKGKKEVCLSFMAVSINSPGTQETEAGGCKFKSDLGYRVRPYLKGKKRKYYRLHWMSFIFDP